MSLNSILEKYLERYAEPEARVRFELPARYSRVLVLPVLAEGAGFLARVEPAFRDARGLLILVVNASDRMSSAAHRKNQELLSTLFASARSHSTLAACPPIHWLRHASLDVLVIDRASPGFRLPSNQGVGLARRIGADVALALKVRHFVTSRGFGSADADAALPSDYFLAGEPGLDGARAVVFPFRHVESDDPLLTAATNAYELLLRYYVLGLESAGSAYAYHSLGSTMYLDFEAYAQTRGFPKRQAGEDYYLLSKLAKLGRLRRLRAPFIEIQCRHSARVPFGTGPAVARLLAEARQGRSLALLAPRGFEVLRELLVSFDEYAATRQLKDVRRRLVALPEASALFDYLESLNWQRALIGASAQAKRPEQLARRLRVWFDALRTLRLLHALRDSCLPRLEWHEALDVADFMPMASGTLEAVLARTRAYEERLSEFVGVDA